MRHLWKRVLKRVDLTSRTLVAVIEPGSCFAGTLAELAFAADRSYMLDGRFEGDNRPAATLTLTAANFGPCPMVNGLTRLETRFLGTPEAVDAAKAAVGRALEAAEAEALGLVTFALDDIDWEDEIRVFLEERASFSPDALTGMEANLRFGGPETMEIEDLRPPHRVAELDLPAPERRRAGRAPFAATAPGRRRRSTWDGCEERWRECASFEARLRARTSG